MTSFCSLTQAADGSQLHGNKKDGKIWTEIQIVKNQSGRMRKCLLQMDLDFTLLEQRCAKSVRWMIPETDSEDKYISNYTRK
jgi:hypothetical protein